MSEPTALYRLFAEDGALLYVGISKNPKTRFWGHSAEKSWWPEVARKEIEWFASRVDAAIAEAKAVRSERPSRNLALPADDGSSSYQLITPKPKAAPGRKGRLPKIHIPKKVRRFHVNQELWDRFGAAVEASPDPEADRSKVLRTFVRWYVGEPGAELPKRPADV